MKNEEQVFSVEGALIKRDAKTGRFVEVQSANGVAKASAKSVLAVKVASVKRKAALKRLADR